jgi:hypothetical protein
MLKQRIKFRLHPIQKLILIGLARTLRPENCAILKILRNDPLVRENIGFDL